MRTNTRKTKNTGRDHLLEFGGGNEKRRWWYDECKAFEKIAIIRKDARDL
jgi:hypothetical protein